MLEEIDQLIIELLTIKNQILAEFPQEDENEEGGYTEKEFDYLAKAYAEAEKNYKFVA